MNKIKSVFTKDSCQKYYNLTRCGGSVKRVNTQLSSPVGLTPMNFFWCLWSLLRITLEVGGETRYATLYYSSAALLSVLK